MPDPLQAPIGNPNFDVHVCPENENYTTDENNTTAKM